MTDPTVLPLEPADAHLVELAALRAEVAKLRPIAAGAHYVWGSDVCIGEDRECGDYTDADGNDRPDVLLCSHAEVRHAHRVDAIMRERYEYLLTNLLDLVERGQPGDGLAAEVADEIRAGVLNAAEALDDDDPRGETLRRPDLVTRVVDAHIAECRAATSAAARERIPTLSGFESHYGVQLSVIGDDVTWMVALGHHDDRRTVAAFLASARVYGIRHEVGLIRGLLGEIRRTWGRLEGECGNCAPGTDACPQCTEIRGGGWWMTWGDTIRPFAEGAFPVSVLEVS